MSGRTVGGWARLDPMLAGTEASRPVRLKGDRAEEVRRVLAAHFAGVARAEFNDFAEEVVLGAAEEFAVYRIELATLYEGRAAARRVVPHDSGRLPPPRVSEATLDVWAVAASPPAAFADGTDELPVDESREAVECGGCRGLKESDCPACGTSGAVGCPRCRGTGRENCPRCRGANTVREVVNKVEKKTPCDCGYMRSLHERDGRPYSCYKCKDLRYTVGYESVYATRPCGACPYEGRVTCGGCRGKGVVRCDPPHGRCGGSGKMPCGTCLGSGRQATSLAVVRTFTPGTAARTVAGSGIPAQAATSLAKAGVFKPVFEIDATEAREEPTPGRGSPAMRRAVGELFRDRAAAAPDGRRIARQRLAVGAAHALKVEYKYDGEEYAAWLLGEGKSVYAPVSPLTALLAAKAREAIELWADGDERKAALALREVLDMAEKDSDCGAAYEHVREEIPAKLRQRGKDATTLVRWAKKNPFVATKLAVLAAWLLVLASPLVVGFFGWFASSFYKPAPAVSREVERRAEEAAGKQVQERAMEVSARFVDTSLFLEGGAKGTLRVAVRKRAFGDPLDKDIVLKFESPSNLTLPESVTVEKGQLETEIPITAGTQPGKYRVKVVPDGLKNTDTFSDACTVTVSEPRKPPLPPTPDYRPPVVSVRFTTPALTLEPGKAGILRLSVTRRNEAKASGDTVLKLAAPAGLKLPDSVTVGSGRAEAEVPVTAGGKAGTFEVRVTAEGPRNAGAGDKATVTVAEAKPSGETVRPEAKPTAADFLPHVPGRTRTYLQASVRGRVVTVTEVESADKEGGVTESRVTRTGTLAGTDLRTGKITWSKAPPPEGVLKTAYRVKNGAVEAGVPGGDKDEVAWEPVFQTAGRWTCFTPGGQLKQYEVVGAVRHKGRDAVVVRSTMSVGDAESVTTSTYVKGVGEVERTVSVNSGGVTAVVGQVVLVEK